MIWQYDAGLWWYMILWSSDYIWILSSALSCIWSSVVPAQRSSLPSQLTTAPGHHHLKYHYHYHCQHHHYHYEQKNHPANGFQAVRNLPWRCRLRCLLEVPGRKTQQVQLPPWPCLWLGESLSSFQSNCFTLHLLRCPVDVGGRTRCPNVRPIRSS